MRAIVVVSALLLWISPALAEQKVAPDGFGPIKFGMTKEEAWEAIDGEGEWKGEWLVYDKEVSWPLNLIHAGDNASIWYFFGPDGANLARLSTKFIEPIQNCKGFAAYFASVLEMHHGVSPYEDRGSFQLDQVWTYVSYVFGFANGASVTVRVYHRPNSAAAGTPNICEFEITVSPPYPVTDIF